MPEHNSTVQHIEDRLDDGIIDPMWEHTQSSLGMFLTCRQKYVLRYLLGIERTGFNIPLLIGSAVHAALDLICDPNDPRHPAKRTRDAIRKVHSIFDDAVDNPGTLTVDNSKMIQARAQALAITEAWYIVNGEWLENVEFLATELPIRAIPEEEFQRVILPQEQDTILREHPELRWAGKLDGVVRFRDDGRRYLLERKTRYQLQGLDPLTLELDHQALFYLHLYHTRIEEGGKNPVEGFLYDVMAKPRHRVPDDVDALSKKMVAAISAEPDKYMSCEAILVDQSSITRAANNAARIMRQADQMTFEDITMNTKACNDYGGCQYRSLCGNGVDCSRPETILDCPQLDLFVPATIHGELIEEEE